MFDALDFLAVTGALPSSAYLGMSVANGSFDAVAYSMAVAHEEEEDRKKTKNKNIGWGNYAVEKTSCKFNRSRRRFRGFK